MLLNAGERQGYSFYCLWVIKGKPKGGAGRLPPTQIIVNMGIFIMLCLQINNVRNPWLIRDKKTPCGNVQVPPNFYCAFLFLDPQKNKYQEIGELLKVFLGECRLKSKINMCYKLKKNLVLLSI